MDAAPPPSQPPVAALALAGLSLSAVVASVSIFAWTQGPLPGEAALPAAARTLAGLAGPHDAALALPSWDEGPRASLPPGLPLLPHPPAHPALAQHPRLWVLERGPTPYAGTRAALATLEGRFGPGARVEAWEGLRLWRFDTGAPPPRWTLEAGLAAGAAAVTLGGRPCPWTGGPAPAYRCDPAPWRYVRAETRAQGLYPRRCVWAHPSAGQPLVLAFAHAPPGRLELEAGIVGPAGEERSGGEVTLTLRAGPQRLGALSVPPGPDLQGLRLSHPGGPLDLEITARQDGARHLCVEARLYEEAP